MVEVVFLGTGDAFARGRRTTTALLIEADGFRMMVESGPSIVEQLARVGLAPADVGHLFVSHAHGDHTLGFPMLALHQHRASAPLHVYAGCNTVNALDRLWSTSYPNLRALGLGTHCWHPLSERDRTECVLAEGVVLHTCPVPHSPGIPTLAARWEFAGGPSIAFVTDTTPSLDSVALARGCDLLIHESAFSAVLDAGRDFAKYYHSTAQQAGEVAREAGCRQLALVHLGPEMGERPDVVAGEARAGTALEVVVPTDGETLVVA